MRNPSQSRWMLECAGLSVRRGGRPVLHDVDLTLRAGECLTLIGPNGAGKTTLLLTMLGLLPPTEGTVRLNGRDIRKLPARQRGRFAAYVPQVAEYLPPLTIADVVAGGRYPHLSPLRPLSAADRAAVAEALERCGLAELAGQPISAVSGGERQKALLAAALAQDAEAMFLDEPTTALDPAVQLELLSLLRDWHARGRTVVVVSHDLHLPASLGGRVVALRGGRIAADGPAPDVLQPQQLGAVYGAEFETATTAEGRAIVVPRWERRTCSTGRL